MEDTVKHRHRWAPLLSILLLLVVGFLHWTEVLGDGGKTMALTYVLCALAGMLGLGWLVFGSGYHPILRWGGPVVLALLVLVLSQFVALEGWRGDMSPDLRVGRAPEKQLSAEGSGKTLVIGATTAADSPCFLGHEQDNWSAIDLKTDWETTPPQELWRRDIGEGWSSFAVASGIAFTQERRGSDQAVTAYDLLSGELHWIQTWPGVLDANLGGPGPRGTPTVSKGMVYAIGPLGKIVCLDGVTGDLIWIRDLPGDYGVGLEEQVQAIAFGRANSPVVIHGKVIAPVGGRVDSPPPGLVAMDQFTGATVWESPGRNVSYATPRIATLAGEEQLLAVHESSVAGHDLETGQILWEHPWPGGTSSNASCSDPVPIGDDRVLLSKGYGVGSSLLQLASTPDGLLASLEWRAVRSLQTKFTNVVTYGEEAVGLSDGILMCTDLRDGSRVWKNGRYGHGQILGVGRLLLVISEAGVLRLVDPSANAAGEVLSELQALEGKTWNQPALAGDVLLLRNAREAVAYRLPIATE